MMDGHDGITEITIDKQDTPDVFFKKQISEPMDNGKIKMNPLLKNGLTTPANFLPFYDQNDVHPNDLIEEIQQCNPSDDLLDGFSDNMEHEHQIQQKDMNEVKSDDTMNFQMRRKLYFNPAYFEPNLLISPPPSAIEFLCKIREVIAIAKQKMNAKRFRPVLDVILEEHSTLSRRDNISQSSMYQTMVKKLCQGCPGCTKSEAAGKSKDNCGCATIQNNVAEWLKSVTYNDENYGKINATKHPESQSSTLAKLTEMINEVKEIDERQAIYSELMMNEGRNSRTGNELDPYEPSPDYNSYNRRLAQTLKQYQPDSPIYSRKSPSYLIVDYETDSLERMIETKTSLCSSPNKFYGELSSQPSPSLSAALPLEEEVEVGNALYNQFEGVRRENNNRKYLEKRMKAKNESDVKIKYDTPMQGSMTIELEYDLTDYENVSNHSDQYEPDTLDRKKTEKHIYGEINPNFDIVQTEYDKGRLLTLEHKHSKRQRSTGYASLDKSKVPNTTNASEAKIRSFLDAIKEDNGIFPESSPHPSLVQSSQTPKYKSIRGNHLIIKKPPPADFEQAKIIEDKNDIHSTIQAYNVELYSNQNLKKSKDFKNAWKKFVDIASKFAEKGDECFDKINNAKIIISKNVEIEDGKPLNKQIDCDVEKGKVKNIIKQLNGGDSNKLRDQDSGYISAESTDSKCHLVENYSASPNSDNNSIRAYMAATRQKLAGHYNDLDLSPDSGLYKIDIEKCSSNSESDDECNYDDVCESGAESIETSSVLYKIIRKD